jgi:hypothetical protein
MGLDRGVILEGSPIFIFGGKMHFNFEHLVEPMKYIALIFVVVYIVSYLLR